MWLGHTIGLISITVVVNCDDQKDWTNYCSDISVFDKAASYRNDDDDFEGFFRIKKIPNSCRKRIDMHQAFSNSKFQLISKDTFSQMLQST